MADDFDPTLSHASQSVSVSDGGSFALSHLEGTSLALPPENATSFVAEVNSTATIQSIASAAPFQIAKAQVFLPPGASDTTSISSAQFLLEGETTEATLIGSLYLAENGGNAMSGNTSLAFRGRLFTQIGPYWASAVRGVGEDEWHLAASLPNGISIDEQVSSVNHLFNFEFPVVQDASIDIDSKADGDVLATAIGTEQSSQINAQWNGSASAWAYALPIETPQIPGDFNGDGEANEDDFLIWATNGPIGENEPVMIGGTQPKGDADLDGDIDFDDLKIWLGNTVTEGIPGDYNQNSIVDASDYTVWLDAFGSNINLQADGNLSGEIDQADYDIWKGLFGEVIPSGIGNWTELHTTVPEPSAFLQIVIAASSTYFLSLLRPASVETGIFYRRR